MGLQNDTNKIPLYTRIGSKVTIVLILILSFFLLKNCAGSFIYGSKTTQQDLDYYYQLGYQAGIDNTKNIDPTKSQQIANPLLLKKYRKGYRDGHDTVNQSK